MRFENCPVRPLAIENMHLHITTKHRALLTTTGHISYGDGSFSILSSVIHSTHAVCVKETDFIKNLTYLSSVMLKVVVYKFPPLFLALGLGH